jgi:hypothetical protein
MRTLLLVGVKFLGSLMYSAMLLSLFFYVAFDRVQFDALFWKKVIVLAIFLETMSFLKWMHGFFVFLRKKRDLERRLRAVMGQSDVEA